MSSFPKVLAGLGIGAVIGITTAMADPYVHITPLHSFSNAPDGSGSFVNAEGGHPRAGLLEGSDGKLYGTTWLDGPGMAAEKPNGGCYDHNSGNYVNHCPGTVFSLAKNGTGFSVIHAFAATDSNGMNSDGNQPVAALTQGSDGYLYGTTTKGGNGAFSFGCGTAFKLQTNGSNFASLHAFCSMSSYADGANPYGSIVQNGDGYVYGASHGGTPTGKGTIFKLSTSCSSPTDNSCITTLHSFSGSTSSPIDGGVPYSSPILGGTNTLYGVTGIGTTSGYGGSASQGLTYSITTSNTFTPMHSFCSGTDACSSGHATDDAPLQTLMKASDGNLYGVTEFGGANGNGFVFRTTTSNTFTVLYNFSSISSTSTPRFANSDGANPLGTLVEGRYGFLYGTTDYGGAHGTGGIYQISKSYDTDGQFTYLYSFDPTSCSSSSDCNSGVCDTSSGNPSTYVCTASAGNYSWSGLVVGSDGRFYGTNSGGGDHLYGTVFAMDTPGTITAVYSAELSTQYISAPIVWAGVTGGTSGNSISIANGDYSLNGGAFTSSAGTLHHGDTLRVRTTSSSSYNTRVLATLTIGSMGNDSFGVTTKSP